MKNFQKMNLIIALGYHKHSSHHELGFEQLDWEAILAPSLHTFHQAVRPWLYPATCIDTEWQSLPDVSSTFSTTGAVIGALSLQEW